MSLDKKYEEVYRSKVQELVDEALRLCKEDSLEESIAIVRYVLSFDRNNEFAKSTLKELINKKDKAIAYYDSIPFIVPLQINSTVIKFSQMLTHSLVRAVSDLRR